MKTTISSLLLSAVVLCFSALSLHAVPVSYVSLTAGKEITIKADVAQNKVKAGLMDIRVDGKSFDAFCIDPWQWAEKTTKEYGIDLLRNAPAGTSGMGATSAKQIRQAWEHFYEPSMTDSEAAGLQIAIWKLVDAGVSGHTFSLISGNDYGASGILSWVQANPNAKQASLVALTSGKYQDYVIETPDITTTFGLFGLALTLMAFIRSRR